MAKKKITFDLKTLAIFGVMIVALVFAIVGVCSGWIAAETTNILTQEKGLEFTTFGEWAEMNSSLVEAGGEGLTGFGAMAAFAIMAIIFTGLTLVASGARLFVKSKLVGLITFVISVLAVACGVAAIITTYTFCGEITTKILPYMPAYGAWFVGVAGVLGGVAGVYNLIKK